jgi:hypothetical protein
MGSSLRRWLMTHTHLSPPFPLTLHLAPIVCQPARHDSHEEPFVSSYLNRGSRGSRSLMGEWMIAHFTLGRSPRCTFSARRVPIHKLRTNGNTWILILASRERIIIYYYYFKLHFSIDWCMDGRYSAEGLPTRLRIHHGAQIRPENNISHFSALPGDRADPMILTF